MESKELQKEKQRNMLYEKICDFLSTRKIAMVSVFLFLLMIIPVLLLTFYNRASGDDYGYGVWVRTALRQSDSFIGVLRAAAEAVISVYDGWQGTWSSVFLFALQPEAFSDKAYVITTLLMFVLLTGAIMWFFFDFLYKKMFFDKEYYGIILILFLVNTIMFVPSTKSALYWYNGTIHYTLPFVLCLVLSVIVFRYVEDYKFGQYAIILLIMIFLGGSNYQAALFSLIVVFGLGSWKLIWKNDKRVLRLSFPVIGEIVGLIISMRAPGNKVRGGDDFGFSVMRGIVTIGKAFVEGVLDVKEYLVEKPLIFVIFLIMFCFMIEAWMNVKEIPVWRKSGLVLLMLFCLYCAMQAPAIYADVGVSGGVYNMNYWTFLISFTVALVIISHKVTVRIQKWQSRIDKSWIHSRLTLPMMAVCGLLCVFLRGDVKDTTWYVCVEYLQSGQATDFKEQMELQTRILTDENITDAVVPFINDVQGPLMHMPVTSDQNAWTNTVTGNFYGKKSVVAIPRDEWEEKYGDEWLKE